MEKRRKRKRRENVKVMEKGRVNILIFTRIMYCYTNNTRFFKKNALVAVQNALRTFTMLRTE